MNWILPLGLQSIRYHRKIMFRSREEILQNRTKTAIIYENYLEKLDINRYKYIYGYKLWPRQFKKVAGAKKGDQVRCNIRTLR